MASSLTRQTPTKGKQQDDNLEVVFIGGDLSLAELYRLKLELDGYWVTIYPTIDDGLEHLRSRMPGLVFVDLGPGAPAEAEGIGRLRSDARFQELPIVLLARGNVRTTVPKAFQLGGGDFLVRVDSLLGNAGSAAGSSPTGLLEDEAG